MISRAISFEVLTNNINTSLTAMTFHTGIHTERLMAGNFMLLRVLDFSYNAVENQHNLICARNFRNLTRLVITGNPFSTKNEHRGLEMEVYARTGAIVVNDEVEKHYLKHKSDKNRLKIKFDELKRVEPDDFQKQKNYFLGIEMAVPGGGDNDDL